jgi:hypothetical protein
MPLSSKVDDIFRQTSINDNVLPETFSQVCADSWQLCGEGVFSWSVFRFYRARLLTQTGVFDPAQPFLLDLQYLRALTGQQIVSTSMDEIARLCELNEKQRTAWSDALNAMIPNVALGDRLLGWFVPGSRVQFFSATQSLGQIADPEFVRMFSAIWLDERTRSPQLRLALLGPMSTTTPEDAIVTSREVGA